MGSHKNVIEINGKLYDAKSGALIASPHVTSPRAPKPTMDGFIRPAKPAASPLSTPAPKAKHHTPRPAASAASRRNLQKSKTLMRHAVKKPAHATPEPTTKTTVTARAAHTAASNQRLTRAQAVEKSAFVNRFGGLSHHHPVAKRTEPLPVRQAPAHATHHNHQATPPKTHHEAPKAKQSASEELFSRALAKAEHEPAKAKKRTKHAQKSRFQNSFAKWGAGVAAAILLVGFITYMNLPNINMQLASARAGMNADLPNYQPTGFKPSTISHQAGQVTINFDSNTDDRNYTVTQAVSGWNSEALQENFLNARNKEFQTTQDSGKTIYMYDDGNATWVNGGIWYQVESNQALSADQLLKIASSL